MSRQFCFMAIMLGASLCLPACSQQTGPERFRVSGTVTYEGEPVPAGSISFEPDSSKGNSGPGTLVEIHDGKFDTGTRKGVIEGAMIARIIGYDGVKLPESDLGKTIFPQKSVSLELPAEDSTQDIELTADK
ncbi:hypothetical protein [Calycomorphotria hydatis]|nr:hypothetical protein [Calycomorphotria hydatis]